MKCFGKIGTNRPDFKKVLEGTFQLDQVEEIYVKKLLQQLRKLEQANQIKT